jgi:tRNA(Ile)-lysidine synthase TilS/MesJ
MRCRFCRGQASLTLKRHRIALCASCYPKFFRKQVLNAIEKERMFEKDDKICVTVSGGKDSMALLHTLHKLDFNVEALYIDLGISGYSEKCRQIVTSFCKAYNISYTIYDLKREGEIAGGSASNHKAPCMFNLRRCKATGNEHGSKKAWL